MRHLIATIGTSLLLVGTTSATTLHVPGGYSTIQSAINIANSGDEIYVQPGTYTEHIDYLGKSLSIRSAEGPSATIIDGGVSSGPAVIIDGSLNASLDGFTITGGYNYAIKDSTAVVEHCTMTQNIAIGGSEQSGGGLYLENSTATVLNCRIVDNSTNYIGGGVRSLDCDPVFVNCLIARNNANSYGGGVRGYNSDPTLINCTIAENTANEGAGFGMYGDVTLTNSVLWGNVPDGSSNQGTTGVFPTYSCLQDVISGTGNIYSSPQFMDFDYRVGASSPCIDSANANALPSGYSCDLDDTVRFGTSGLDMGAYEYGTPSCGISTGACCTNDQCVILSQDICDQVYGNYLGDSTTCASNPCPTPCLGDVTGDGQVNVNDLLTVIANWNNCP
jgi:hypothetical protein